MSTEPTAVSDGEVPPPVPPGDPDAWYAPSVVAQYTVRPGVVATIRRTSASDTTPDDGVTPDGGTTVDESGLETAANGSATTTSGTTTERADHEGDPADARGVPFAYETREPSLGPTGQTALAKIVDHFADGHHRRPLTREGVIERARAGFERKYERAIDRLVDASPALRRRLDYHALRRFRLLGEATPLAVDDRIEVADAADPEAGLIVHTETFGPVATGLDPDEEFAGRVAATRLARYTVEFAGFAVPVVVYRDHLLGTDSFDTRYAVREPSLLPGDRELLSACTDRLWETRVERVLDDRRTFVRRRARRFLSRRLAARNTRAWVDAVRHRLRSAAAAYGIAAPPVDARFADDRLADLVYYVLRDVVGESVLTIPLRDERLEDVEANRVDERVKVVPRTDAIGETVGRVPTNLTFEDTAQFVNVVTGLAARDGTELNAATPSAKVNVDLPEVTGTMRCAVALPVVSEDGPHLSVRKQAPDTMTPVELIERDAISPELVATLWLLYEHDGVVLFSGPTGVGKTTLLNAHMPFVPFDRRPISIDEGSREVAVPHETGVSLTTRDHEQRYKRVSMAELMTEANYLNPDVEVIAEINTPASFETFGETLNTGHGVLGTTHAETPTTLVNRVIEQGLPAYLLGEIDLVVFPVQIEGERYVRQAVELSADPTAFDDCAGESGVISKDGARVAYNRVGGRSEGEFQFAYDHPELGDPTRSVNHRVFDRVAERTDRTQAAVEREFHRKRQYVESLRREGVTGFQELFELLADLRTDEPATVERLRRSSAVGGADD